MDKQISKFLNIKYEGERFSGGRLPLDILADLPALEDILTTFAREIWIEENNRARMPNGYTSWFSVSLSGVDEGSALPKLELTVQEDTQQTFIPENTRASLMQKAEAKFAMVLKAANDGQEAVLSTTQIRNFNRFLTNLKPNELFKYSPDTDDTEVGGANVVALDVERRKRFLTSVTTFYEQRVQGRARLNRVDEKGNLRFVSVDLKEFSVMDSAKEPSEYGENIGAYYEFDLTVERRHDDRIHSVITIHDLSLLEDPAVTAIDDMASLADGWLDGFGRAVSENIRNIAKKLLLSSNSFPSFYAVAPTEEGGILLEYDANGWDYGIEFHADGSSTVFGIDLEGTDEFSDTFVMSDYRQFVAKVKETLD